MLQPNGICAPSPNSTGSPSEPPDTEVVLLTSWTSSSPKANETMAKYRPTVRAAATPTTRAAAATRPIAASPASGSGQPSSCTRIVER